MATPRDPVSETMDDAARALLDRVYRADGAWAGTRLLDPTSEQLARWLLWGINVRGPDPVASRVARTRWMRAYVRALWYQHKWFSGAPGGGWRAEPRAIPRLGLQTDVGRWAPARGVIPPGRAVRARIPPGDAAERRAAVPPGARWADGGPASSDVSDRDY